MNTDELRDALRRDAELAGRPPTDLVHRVAGLRRRSHRRRAAVVGGALAIVVAVVGVSVLDGVRDDRPSEAAVGVDGGAAAEAGVDTEALAQAYRDLMANAGGAGSRAIDPESLVEYLPNRQYLVRNGNVVTLSDAVVVGNVTSVSPGRAFYAPEDDDTVSIEVPFDDPRAMWRTVHAEVAVSEVLAGRVPDATVVFGLSVAPQTAFDVMADGLPALGEMVFFLDVDSAVFDYESGIDRVADDGAIMAEIGPDGRLTLPAVEPDRAPRLLALTPTLDSLREVAGEPARVVPLETLGD